MHERTLYYLQRMHDLCVDIQNFIDGIELDLVEEAYPSGRCLDYNPDGNQPPSGGCELKRV